MEQVQVHSSSRKGNQMQSSRIRQPSSKQQHRPLCSSSLGSSSLGSRERASRQRVWRKWPCCS
jgi:hypothetical protein